MKVRYIKSATVVIEHKGVKVLCDPWLTDGIYYGSWYHWPPLKFTAMDFEDVDYIYISHVHPDHCDEAALKDFPKEIPVLIHDFHEKFLLRRLKALGFQKVIEVPNRGTVNLGEDFNIEILAGDDCDSRKFSSAYGINMLPDYKKTRQIDSLAVFSSRDRVVVNSNDVPVALIAGAFPYLSDKYRNIDLLLVSYAGAGPFPQAYDLDSNTKLNHAIGAAYSFIGGTMLYIKHLNPRFYLPYAGQYTLGGKLHTLNQFKGSMELDELMIDLVPAVRLSSMSEMVLLDSGEWFDVDAGQASRDFTPTDFIARDRYIKNILANRPLEYEADADAPKDFTLQLESARETLWGKQKEYGYFHPMHIFIDVGQSQFYHLRFDSKEVVKTERTLANEDMIVARLDPKLFKRILDRRANWNNAEIGSHIKLFDGIKSNSNRNYHPMPHFLLSYLQAPSGVLVK